MMEHGPSLVKKVHVMKKEQLCRITLSANAGISLIIQAVGEQTAENLTAENLTADESTADNSTANNLTADNKTENDNNLRHEISKGDSLRLWFDALHEQSVNEFSTLSENIIEKMMKCEDFYWPDAIVYTHCHKDHFSASLTKEAMALWPDAKIILPEKIFPDQITITEETVLSIKGADLDFIKTTHEGEEYKDTPHYACLIRKEGVSILITGDSEVGSPMLKEKLTERGMVKENSPDIVIVDFPWITLKKGRDSLKDWLWPDHLVIDHLPFPEEDETGFNKATKRYAKSLKKIGHVVIMNAALQQENIILSK